MAPKILETLHSSEDPGISPARSDLQGGVSAVMNTAGDGPLRACSVQTSTAAWGLSAD